MLLPAHIPAIVCQDSDVFTTGGCLVQFAQEEDISLEGSFSDQLRRVSNILPRGPRPY